jgi:hypothetical protein
VTLSLSLGPLHRGAAADKEGEKAGPRPAAGVKVTVDTTEAPELADWGKKKAKELVEKWHPLVAGLLKSDGFTLRGRSRSCSRRT